jgi:hypothetical protein
VDALALETAEAGHLQAAVSGPRRDYHASGPDTVIPREIYAEVAVLPSQADRLEEASGGAPSSSAFTRARLASSKPESPAGKLR